MNLDLNEEQQLLHDGITRLCAELGGSTRARERFAPGLDREALRRIAEMGLLAIRSPEGEMGALSVFEAMLVTEASGRALLSVPLVETILAVRLLSGIDRDWHDAAAKGERIISLALHDAQAVPKQLVHYGAEADGVIALSGDRLALYRGGLTPLETDHGAYRLARFDVGAAECVAVLATGPNAITRHASTIEEWKLLTAAELCGMAGASLALAVDYAKERKAFGRPIGSFQAIAHPLADRAVDLEGARLLAWWAAWRAARHPTDAPAGVSMAFAWAATMADQTTRKALHVFGGYGLALEHDAQLFFRRAKARALLLGDPGDELATVADRLWRDADAGTIETADPAIDFSLGEKAERVAADTEALLARVMTPERRARMHDSYDGHDAEITTELAKEGLLFAEWPKEWGGRAAGPIAGLAALRSWEKMGVAPHAQIVSSMVGQIVMHFGSDQARSEILPRIADGRSVCCMGYSEPGSGSDIFAASTRADWDETRQAWVINGQKMWTTGANLADFLLILTRTDRGATRHEGLTLFIVPMATPGIEVHPVFTVMDERSNGTFYSDVVVPDAYRIGPVGGGVGVMAKALTLEQAGVYGPGDMRIFPTVLEWARRPDASGTAPIERTDVRKRLARAAIVAQVGDLLSMRGAWFAEAHPDAGRSVYGPMAKHFYGDHSQTIYSDLMDLAAPEVLDPHGPLGTIEHMHRQIQVATVYGGTSEVQRSQIAEVFLGLPKSR